MPLTSALLASIPGLAHGFGSLDEEVPSAVLPYWEGRHARWKQVHGKSCVRLTAPGTEGLEGDAFWTEQRELPTAVVTADCVPILFARRDGQRVAAVHAGWRGTMARITEALMEEVRRDGGAASDWVAAIGPAIGPCCYEVSEELADQFAREFPAGAVPRFRHLDLPEINRQELLRLGLAQVELLRACTRCSQSPAGTPLFHSYRREGAGVRQYSVICRI